LWQYCEIWSSVTIEYPYNASDGCTTDKIVVDRQLIHEHGALIPSEEINTLLAVLLRLLRQPELSYTEQGTMAAIASTGRSENGHAEATTSSSQDDREYQKLIFTAIGNLFTRAENLVSKENCQSVVKVCYCVLSQFEN
jgi:hypothetical protein